MKKLIVLALGALLLGNPTLVLADSPLAIVPVVSAATEGNHVFCAVPCSLFGFSVAIGATSGFILLMDAVADPADGAVTPVKCYPITSNGTNGGMAAFWANDPARFRTGLVVVFSTTGCFTKTEGTGAYFSGEVVK